MRLSFLLQSVSPLRVTGAGLSNGGVLSDPEIASIHCRSGNVRPGGLFVAVRGQHADGHDFITDALDRGAAAIVAEHDEIPNAIVARVHDSRKALASLAAAFYGYPAQKLTMIGLTGTNGKTTTAAMIENILRAGGLAVGVIGTGNYRFAGKQYTNPLTTPESIDLQRILADMANAGVTHVVMEVSSHALDQARVAGCLFDVAVFTNLTQDHLDYHGTMAAYWESKRLLFTRYLSTGDDGRMPTAVINCNDEHGRQLRRDLDHIRLIPVGETGNSGAVSPREIRYAPEGITGKLATPRGELSISSSLCGHYNCENILCAVGVSIALGVADDVVCQGIETFPGVPGRLEKIGNNSGRTVFVDYAHTPDAIANVLSTVRAFTSGRLFCVFGCGGDRDRKKRPDMGRIAVSLADGVVITSDNPRSEEPGHIIEEILAGIGDLAERVSGAGELSSPEGGKRYLVEPDRSRAIMAAVLASRPGDTIVIAGKGSEPYQILKDRTVDFDDRLEAGKALRLLENIRRPALCEI